MRPFATVCDFLGTSDLLCLSTRLEINVFLAAITGALLRWLLLAVLALRRTRRLAPHPVLFAKIHIYFLSST